MQMLRLHALLYALQISYNTVRLLMVLTSASEGRKHISVIWDLQQYPTDSLPMHKM